MVDGKLHQFVDLFELCPRDLVEASKEEVVWATSNGAHIGDIVADLVLVPSNGSKLTRTARPESFRGLRATKQIPKDTIVIHMPSWLVLSVANPRISWPGSPWTWLHETELAEKPKELLALILLAERFKMDSYFRPLICALPREYPELPLFWSDEKLRHADSKIEEKTCFRALFDDNSTRVLPGSSIVIAGDSEGLANRPLLSVGDRVVVSRPFVSSKSRYAYAKVEALMACTPRLQGLQTLVRNRRRSLRQTFSRLAPKLLQEFPHIFSPAVFNLKTFTWAFATVLSRGWLDDSGSLISPVIHSFNHRDGGRLAGIRNIAPNNATADLFETMLLGQRPDVSLAELRTMDGTSVVTAAEYAPGDEVHLSYTLESASLCNVHAVYAWGFSLEYNDCYCDVGLETGNHTSIGLVGRRMFGLFGCD